MTERRALKLRCGPVGQLGLLGLRGIPRLSLIWRKPLQPLQQVHVQQGALISHGWTISFNPKIVVVQNHNHMPAGASRLEQVFSTPERAHPDGKTHRVMTKLLRETVFADRLLVSKAKDSPDIERASRSRPAKRGAELPMMRNRHETRSRLAPVHQQHFDPPQGDVARAQGLTQRKASSLATILLQHPAKKPADTSFIVWPRQKPDRLTYKQSTAAKSPDKAAPIFIAAPSARQAFTPPLMWRSPAKPRDAVMQITTGTEVANASAASQMRKRPTAEQVWLKSPESSNRLIEFNAGRHFAQPIVSQAPHPQIAATPLPPPHAGSQPRLPEMDRLVDEVIRRIDRVARDERLRRGI